jgi:putative membrane protein
MKKNVTLLVIYSIGLIWSGIRPYNFINWVGEVMPAIVGLILLIITFNKFRFTFLTYSVILISCLLLFIGSHYTFSRVPFLKMEWLMKFERNNFDKLGHFFQGIVPGMITWELFLRKGIVKGKKWLLFITFCICMTTAAIYEIIELVVCIIAQKHLETFTGTQGFIWDSQTDMFAAMLGRLFMIFFMKGILNRQIDREFGGIVN